MSCDRRVALSIALLVSVAVHCSSNGGETKRPAWTGEGRTRVLVTVPPRDLAGRDQDETPADVLLDGAELGEAGRAIDVESFQVVRYDPATGQPVEYDDYAHGRSPADRPFRWLDASIPYDFPEMRNNVDRTQGKLPRESTVRGGYFYNAVGDWRRGRLTWMHTQDRDAPSHYAIYFDFLPTGEQPRQIPPRGWIGDGLPRCAKDGAPSMSADHCRVDLDDWNDDGLIDMVVGEAYGHLFVWLNQGTPTKPKFTHHRFVSDETGTPIDVGAGSSPKVVDWDGDGHKDLLIGAEWNRVVLFLNAGTNADRQLRYAGFVEADGDVLKLPISPLVRGSEQIFKRDYYPVLETVDWDGDGDVDLLAGGYITGRIYFYENHGTDEEGLPRLRLSGPLEADGEPLNVGHWCAAPCAADFDGDGDLDLLSGSLPMTMSAADSIGSPAFLRYYENVGSSGTPRLSARPMPSVGKFPAPRLATPRAHDWDADGDLDLIVSARESLYLYENDGSAEQPRFVAHDRPLTHAWGASTLPADQFLDWNKDGLIDIFVRGHYSVRLNDGRGNPWAWTEEVPVLPKGQRIEHPTGMGDDWFWPLLDDFDQDGHTDSLFGDWHGQVWFHRNLGSTEQRKFDLDGVLFKLDNDQPIKVGPVGRDPNTDFNALQGGRPTLCVADFDRDGKRDLVVGDTYGKVRFFRQSKQGRFDQPVVIGDLGIRLLVESADWNADGWMDVVAGAANGRVRVILNSGADKPGSFAAGFDPGLPPIPQPRVLMVDLNGDGDQDLFLPSTQGSCFVERSFLEHGYARGRIVDVQQRR